MLLNVFLMAPQGAEGGGSSLFGFLPFILIILIMYFLMIRPQMRKQKERQRMIDNIQKGDNVVTTGGIHGKIMGFSDDGKTVILRVDEKVKLNIDRSAIGLTKSVQKP